MEVHLIEATAQESVLTVLIAAYNCIGWRNVMIHKDLHRPTKFLEETKYIRTHPSIRDHRVQIR